MMVRKLGAGWFSVLGRQRRRVLLAVVLAAAMVGAQLGLSTPAQADINIPYPPTPMCVSTGGNPTLVPCTGLTYLLNPASLGMGLYLATPAESGSLTDLEQQAVANTISDHGLSPSDTDAVMTWGHDDAEAELWALLVQAIQTPAGSRTTDQQNAVDWLSSVEQAEAVGAAEKAGEEYVNWAGLSDTDYEILVGTDPSQDDLTSFLSQTPEPSPGYCTYTSPDGSYTPATAGASDQTCDPGGCTSILGCAPPTPSYDQFVQWGQDDENNQLNNELFDTPAFAQEANNIATLETFGGAVGGGLAAGLGVSFSLSASGVLAGSALQQALFPFASRVGYSFVQGTFEALTTADAAADVAGGLTAAGVGAIVGIVIVAVTTAVLEGIDVF
ncbi:MAG TPA: hypothetical protein VEJ84_00735, partial [Acidimicrobiales bacterium]|nr:hypothetical protein [Acidimicrobiales bacterium]